MFLENETALTGVGESNAKSGSSKRPPAVGGRFHPVVQAIPRRLQASGVPLAFAQQRLWFLDQLHPGSPLYNFPTACRLRGPLDRAALQFAISSVVSRHEVLRTRFVCVDGEPVQVIEEPRSIALPTADLRARPAETREAEAKRLLETEARRPFDLAKDPMVRALLVALGDEEHLLVVTMHHIATDAWSMGIFYRELAACYEARLRRRAAELPELPIQYADFALWQRESLQGERLENLMAYWKQQLAGAPAVLELPADRPRPSIQTFRGGTRNERIPARVVEALKPVIRREGVTPFMLFLAAFQVLLHRYSRQTDILVGCPIAGRTLVETERVIGFFVNTLVMRTDLGGDPTFKELLRRVREAAFGAFAHQDLPFEKLVEELHPDRNANQVPLIQVMFVLQNAPAQSLKLADLALQPVEVGNETAKFDLTLFLEEREQGFTAAWEFNLDLFDEATIARMHGHFVNLLEGIAGDPGQRVSRLPLLGETERFQLLVEWNNTRTEYPRDKCVHELVEEQARLSPEAVAVTFGDRHLTYQELNAHANQLAHHLRRAGVKPGVGVGICLERSLNLIVGLLGTLKAGGGYAALEAGIPRERLAAMLEDLQTPVILTQEKMVPRLEKALELAAQNQFPTPRLLVLDRDWDVLKNESTENPEPNATPEQLAYISFTSGSTGGPKGVMIPHRAVVRLVRGASYAGFSPTDVFLQLASVAFDASTFEIWSCLANGARLVVFPPYTPSLAELGEAFQHYRITTVWLTSGLFHQLVDARPECLKPLRQILTGGDVVSAPHVRKALEVLGGCRLINGYGPTENTTFSTTYTIPHSFADDRAVPIGRPIANTHCYVVDEQLQPVPVGVPGELLVGGDGLALGYLNRPGLTAEKFIPHPFSDEPRARVYRTGDMVRYAADGTLEFLGRADLQVKVRGFRIELGEIESVLCRHPLVGECVVLAREDTPGTKRLVAYVVPRQRPGPGSIAELRHYLGETLPEYMLPGAFVFMDALPLTANGKVDRRALPAPDQNRADSEVKYVEPRDALERSLAGIWENVLGVQPIGMADKFFELGGHSLLAIRLLAQVEKKFGKKLPLAAVFQASSVGRMAALLRDEKGLEPGSSVVQIQSKGTRPPLFLVHGVGGGMFWGYSNLSRCLGPGQPLMALKSRSMDGREEFETIEEMAAQYVADLRACQPAGPYHLGGYCFGGNVAYEMARQLRAQGQEVALLALMNCAPPNSSYARVRWDPVSTLKFLRNLAYLVMRSLKWGPQQRREFLRWKAALLRRRLSRVLAAAGESARQIDVDDLVDLSTFTQEQKKLWETHVQAQLNYVPGPYDGKVTLFRSRGHPLFCSYDRGYGWGELAAAVEVHVVPGAHESILEEPHVRALAEKLNKCMQELELPGQASTTGKTGAPEQETEDKLELETPAGADDTWTDYPRELCVHQLFEQQARRTPEAVAVVFGERQLTYRELNRRANRLADHLQFLGVKADVPVGICLERSLDLAVGVLGILKAGGAYVPLDPAYPRERLQLMLESARVNVLVTHTRLASLASATVRHVVSLDLPLPAASSEEDPPPKAGPGSLAYVIYTSGSTGKPKGVAMEHRPLVNLVCWQLGNSKLGMGDKTLQFASLSFDVSFQEMFSTWAGGGVLVLIDEELRRDAMRLARFLREQQVNRLFLPFVALNQLAEAVADGAVLPDSLREVITAGEQLRITGKIASLFDRLDQCTLHNHYGPSESHVVTAYDLDGAPAAWPPLPPIGRPIANVQIHLLDDKLEPVPEGGTGELYIGGDCLARGYLHQPELTTERFIPDPFRREPSARLYRTGDLARRLPDGNIEFLGRADHQVKIRGYRIELGEIETVLGRHPSVRECVVAAREEVPGQKRLVAYLVAQPGANTGWSELRRFLQERLPDYMVPASGVFLEALPLTPSGKVNRLGLPAPSPARPELDAQYVAPRNAMEERIAGIWAEVMHLDKVGVQDDFFELGGHSLLVGQVISRVREALQLELPLASLFEAPTVAALAEGIANQRWGRGEELLVPPLQPGPRRQPVPLSFAQQSLWIIDRLESGSAAYHVPVGIRLKGALDVAALEASLNEIIRRHEILRTTIAFEGGNPAQVIAANERVVLARVDLGNLSAMDREAEARRILGEESRQPFDLARGPLFRGLLLRLGEREHILGLVMHHVITDGWSLTVLFNELDALYSALAKGRPMPALPSPAVQYADYAQWQQEWMRGPFLEREVAFWKAKLAGAPSALELPSDPGLAADPRASAQETILLSRKFVESLTNHGRREGLTLFMMLMAGLAVTLQRWTEQTEMVIGTVVAGRNRRELENLIGCFMNFVPVRLRLLSERSGREFLRVVKNAILEAQAHQDCPFEKVVEAVNPDRRSTRNPLYNVALLLQNFPATIINAEGLETHLVPVELQAALLDLRFIAEETAEGISLACEYRKSLFEPSTIRLLLKACEGTLDQLVREPELQLAGFKLPEELAAKAAAARVQQDRQTIAIASTFTAEPVEESLRHWMKELEIPARIEFAAYNQVFQELLDPASLLSTNARGLNVVLLRWTDWEQLEGAEPDDAPGREERLNRNLDEFLNALKTASRRARAPWLICLCPEAPDEAADRERGELHRLAEARLAAELDLLAGVHLLRPAELQRLYPVDNYHDPRSEELGRVPYTPVYFTALGTMIARKLHALKRPPLKVIVLDCDQTMWTGVCGEDGPLGVQLPPEHRALQEFMRAQHEAGVLLCLCSKNNEEDVTAVFNQRPEMPLRREHFAAWRINWRPKSENLKALAAGLRLGLDSFVFVDDNPVECAEVEAGCPEVLTLQLPENAEAIPAFLNHCWVFDHLKLSAEDRGRTALYQQEQQREQFRNDSASLAEFLAGLDLKVDIASMSEDQLTRVAQLTQRTNQFNCSTRRRAENELRELRATGRHEVFTTTVSDRFGDYGLVGVVICERTGNAISVDTFLLSCRVLGRGVEHQMLARIGEFAVRQGLETVDLHFVPSAKNRPAFNFLESIASPFRQSHHDGFLYRMPAKAAAVVKVDLQATAERPEPAAPAVNMDKEKEASAASPARLDRRVDGARCRRIALEANDAAKIQQLLEARTRPRVEEQPAALYVAPRTELEERLCRIWEEVLRAERVGVRDDFFAMGGHSLLAVRLFAEVERQTGAKLPLVTLFQHSTVEQLAEVLSQQSAATRSSAVPIQPRGSKPPLFLVHGAGGDVLWGYANLAAHLDPDQPVYGIKSRAMGGAEEFKTLEEMADFYVRQVRRLQPAGPYQLGGYCFGGNVAYEMARQLHEQGEKVSFLAMLDAAPSNCGYESIPWWKPGYALDFALNSFYWLQDFFDTKPQERREFVRRKARAWRRKLVRKILHTDPAGPKVDLEEVIELSRFPAPALKLWQLHLDALAAHVSRPYPGRVTLFRTRGQPLFCSLEKDFGWGKLAKGGVDVRIVPGSHESVFLEPAVRSLAGELNACLTKETAGQGRGRKN